MYILENIKMALESIKSNRMRSFLTMLGIIIGISSVIIIISAGDGAKLSMMSQFEEIGATTVQVKVNTKKAEAGEAITMDDINAVKLLSGVNAVSPLSNSYGTLSFDRHESDAIVYGSSDDFEKIQGVKMTRGRFFTSEDYQAGRSVMVLDESTAVKFFGTTNVIGMSPTLTLFSGSHTVTLKVKIVGISKSQMGSFAYDGMPAFIYLPFTTLNNALGEDGSVSNFYIKTADKDLRDTVGKAALNTLEARHGTRGRDVFTAEDMMKDVDQMNSMIGMVQSFVAAVAAISLLVGGIGVMNIMLVSVSERTREIGIRKALGAKTAAIMQQFLTEAAILSLTGGVIGLVLGYLGSTGICSLLNVTPVFTLGTIGLTLLFSMAVGIFFGIYPAKQAARLSPIEALRHE